MYQLSHLNVWCIQLKPVEVEYNSHGITSPKLLKVAVLNRGYPPSITFAVTYKEELRRMGRPVWVQLDLLGAGKNLTFMCKAYEEENHKQLDRSRNGELDSWTDDVMWLLSNHTARLTHLVCYVSLVILQADHILPALFMCIAFSPSTITVAAAASQSPLTPSPDMVNDLHSTASPHAETGA